MIVKGEYIIGVVNEEFIVVSLDSLYETYQMATEQKNINCFVKDDPEAKVAAFKSFMTDSIAFVKAEKWKEFYNRYKEIYKEEKKTA